MKYLNSFFLTKTPKYQAIDNEAVPLIDNAEQNHKTDRTQRFSLDNRNITYTQTETEDTFIIKRSTFRLFVQNVLGQYINANNEFKLIAFDEGDFDVRTLPLDAIKPQRIFDGHDVLITQNAIAYIIAGSIILAVTANHISGLVVISLGAGLLLANSVLAYRNTYCPEQSYKQKYVQLEINRFQLFKHFALETRRNTEVEKILEKNNASLLNYLPSKDYHGKIKDILRHTVFEEHVDNNETCLKIFVNKSIRIKYNLRVLNGESDDRFASLSFQLDSNTFFFLPTKSNAFIKKYYNLLHLLYYNSTLAQDKETIYQTTCL